MKPPPIPPQPPRRRAARSPVAPLEPPPTPDALVARLLALVPPGELPALWSRAEFSRRLTPAERPGLDDALARLQEDRQLLGLSQGKGVYYLFAGPLRGWLAGAPRLEEGQPSLGEAYRRLARESGGFPDVKISALQAALGPAAAGTLAAELIASWRRGEATLSLGDWSLASEETRAAAVEMDGEKYLLVRFEEVD